MKSKMKSTFAIIAVALMVIVAVVPMVGVFTSDSDAATPPASDNYADPKVGTITIKGMVYDVNGGYGAPITDYYAMAKWGTSGEYSQLSAAKITNGAYTITIYDNKITNVVVTIVKADATEVSGYAQVTEFGQNNFQTMTKGTTYTANFRSATYHVATGEITLANSTSTYLGNLFDVAAGDYITVKYSLFSNEAGTASITNGTALLTDNKITVAYSGTYSKVYIKITGVDAVVDDVIYSKSITSKIYELATSGTATAITLDQYMVTFTTANQLSIPQGSVSLTAAYYTDGTEDKTYATSFTAATKTDVKTGGVVKFFCTAKYTEATTPVLINITKISATVTFGTVTDTVEKATYNGQSYTPAGFYGTFAMDATSPISAYDGQNLVFSIKATITEAGQSPIVTTTTPATYVQGGKFVALYKAPTLTSGQSVAYNLKATTTGFTVASIGDLNQFDTDGWSTSTISTIGAENIVVSSSGYTLIKGKVNLSDSTTSPTAVPESVSITVSGVSSAFGYPMSSGKITFATSIETNHVGEYSFYVKTYDEISFAAASTEKFTLVDEKKTIATGTSIQNLDLAIKAKKMSFAFKDGDGNPITGVTINFDEESDLYAETGKVTGLDAITGFQYITIYRSYVDLNGIEFWPTKTATDATYTFSYSQYVPAKYTEDSSKKMDINTLETTYTANLYDTAGNVVKVYENQSLVSPFTFKTYSVYKTESGSLVFGDASAAKTVNIDANGQMSITVPSKYVNATITAKKQTVLVLEPTVTQYVLENYYLFNTDSATVKTMTIRASADSLTATLTKLDEKTGIAGATATLYSKLAGLNEQQADFKVADATTDSKGGFTILSPTVIDENYVLMFEAYGFVFSSSYYVLDADKEKKDSFASVRDLYSIVLVDADGADVKLTKDYVFSMNGMDYKVKQYGSTLYIDTTESTEAATGAALTEGMVISPEYKTAANGTAVRTFSSYTVTADDIEDGILCLETLYSTYKVELQDSQGVKLKDNTQAGTAKIGVYQNDTLIGTTTDMTWDAISKVYYLALPALSEGREYMATVADGTYYSYSPVPVAFTENSIAIKSLYTKVVFTLQDAAGNELIVPTEDHTDNPVTYKWKVSSDSYYDAQNQKVKRNVFTSPASNTMYFYGDESAKYTPTDNWTDMVGGYTFKTKAAIVDGKISAAEEAVVFSVVDALALPITGVKATITPYNAAGVAQDVLVNKGTLNDAGMVSVVFDTTLYGAYSVALFNLNDTAIGYYTFDKIADTIFVADQCSIVPTFVTANGYELDSNVKNGTTVTAYNALGTAIGRPAEFAVVNNVITVTPLIVDVEEAAYYSINAAGGVDKYTFDESETPVFVANESYITGTVPYSGKGTGSATLELYLEGNMVKEMKDNVNIVDKYYYEAILDLSGYIGETAGVVFDSIIVVYYENGVELGYAAVDPYTAVNNIVIPEVEVYVAVLDAPSALISRHVSIAQVGNTATVSADGQFIVADDDAIYTDGQYIYTFAGWYVDNEKVSSAPSFTFSLTENVVIVPEYTVKYEKISDANAQVDPEIIIEEITKENTGIDTNVLIIGIAAVIVALIAVVYAVIKKE